MIWEACRLYAVEENCWFYYFFVWSFVGLKNVGKKRTEVCGEVSVGIDGEY